MSKQKKQLRQAFNNEVLERDNHRCVICGAKVGVVVHHIADRHDMPEGQYDPDNGITLCPDHHRLAEEYHISDGKYWIDGMHPDNLFAMIGSLKRVDQGA